MGVWHVNGHAHEDVWTAWCTLANTFDCLASQVDSVSFKEGLTIPKQIKMVNKTKVMDSTRGFQPGITPEVSAKMPRSNEYIHG